MGIGDLGLDRHVVSVLVKAGAAYAKDAAIDYLKGRTVGTERTLTEIIRSLSTAHRYLVRAAKVPDVRGAYAQAAIRELERAEAEATGYVIQPGQPRILSADLSRSLRELARRLKADVLTMGDIAGVEKELFGLTDTILSLME